MVSPARRTGLLSATWLPGAGNLTPVTAEGELLEKIGDRLTHRQEFDLDAALGRDTGYPSSHPQRLRQGVTKVDLDDALLTRFRKGAGASPHCPQGIEAYRHRARTRAS